MEEHLLDGDFTQAILKCFTTAKANAFENLLEPLQKLLRLSPPIAHSLAQSDLFSRILTKLTSNKALTRLNLLRIVQSICDASDEQGALINVYGLYEAIQKLAENDTAILVRDMASKLIRSCDDHDVIVRSGKRRGAVRRTSVSTTPPTPTSGRSSNSTYYYIDRERPRSSILNGPVPFRATPGSSTPRESSVTSVRSSNGSGSTTPTLSSGTNSVITTKSRLPRTTSSRASRSSLIYNSPKKDEKEVPSPAATQGGRGSPVMIPNSRRRRQTSGGEMRWV